MVIHKNLLKSQKLWGTPSNIQTRRVELAALSAGLEIPLNDFTLSKASDKEAKEYLQKLNPNGRIPTLETPDGAIFESGAILRHIARLDKSNKLYGSDNYHQALVDQWVDWVTCELEPATEAYLLPYFGWVPHFRSSFESAHNDVKKCIRILDHHTKNAKKYLVGDHLTIADIAVASAIASCFQWVWDDKYRKSITHLTQWFEHITSLENWRKDSQVFGKPIFCKQPLPFFMVEHEPEEEKKPESKAEKAAKSDKAEKAKPEQKKEAPKPAAKKPKDEDSDGEAPKEEKKDKNPLDVLPPSTFNLFDFKTLFVNATDKKEALDFFWKNFDSNGYSIWLVVYEKAEGEGKVLFLTSNLMNGFLQRLDHFRKYAFGVHGVYGEEPSLEIRGVWVWRGTEIPAEIRELDSYEYHQWIRLDPTKEADRKKVEEFWCKLNEDEDMCDGLKARTVKYFKQKFIVHHVMHNCF